jgi:hypothetical protein
LRDSAWDGKEGSEGQEGVPNRLQAAREIFGNLELDVSLELGAWDLELPPMAVRLLLRKRA